MAMEAWSRFSTAAPNFIHICDSHMQASAIAMADSEDAILFFSYSGSTKDMYDPLQIASQPPYSCNPYYTFSKIRRS